MSSPATFWTLFSKKDTKPLPLKQEELIFLENELLRVETSLRMEIRDLWRFSNDQQAKTLRLEKSRSMKFPIQQEEPKKISLLDKVRGRKQWQ